jgi:hypothetical protein
MYCDDANVCTLDLFYNETIGEHCDNKPKPSTTVCKTECHVPDATSGRCRVQDASCQLGDFTECGAYCPPTGAPGSIYWTNSSCSQLFARHQFFSDGNDLLSFSDVASGCLADQCIAWMLGPSMVISTEFAPLSVSFGNALADCKDLLNPAIAKLSCIEAETMYFSSEEYDGLLNTEFFEEPSLPID